jgi:hypothetical protein|tara:strand:- start:490 stop:855 length:366 start_codon:yes stop_codon:yes gene_type:complete
MELFFIIFSFFLFFFPNGVRMLFLKRKKKLLTRQLGWLPVRYMKEIFQQVSAQMPNAFKWYSCSVLLSKGKKYVDKAAAFRRALTCCGGLCATMQIKTKRLFLLKAGTSRQGGSVGDSSDK